MSDSVIRVLLLCTDGDSSRIVASELRRVFGSLTVICEKRISRWTLIRRRAQRLGLMTCLGQLAFLAAVVPLLNLESRKRKAELLRPWAEALSDLKIDHHVQSANSQEAISILSKYNPDIVVVNGTRILSKATLECIPAPFINMHAGLTPRYRGVHGGYWALAEGRADLVGTTVHLVDPGIDSGAPLEQVTFTVSNDDNYASYPILHTLAGVPSLVSQVRLVAEGKISAKSGPEPSRLWYHPTLLQYLQGRLLKRVR